MRRAHAASSAGEAGRQAKILLRLAVSSGVSALKGPSTSTYSTPTSTCPVSLVLRSKVAKLLLATGMRVGPQPSYAVVTLRRLTAMVCTPPRTGRPGRPKGPYRVPRPGLVYATVEKVRKKGRVVEILTRVVFGTMAAVAAASAGSRVSRSINTSFIERQNLTDRHHNARKSRKTYRFSKDWRFHEAATYFTPYSGNFCRPVRTLREPTGSGRWRRRTPAMAARLTGHVWSISEWISFPALLRS